MAYVDIFTTENKYQIIYADPPWSYQDKKCNGACEFHYSTMPINDICKLPIERIAADDCVLFWATYPLLPDALKLIEAWGFKYKSIGFQWIKKNRSGIGNFFGLGRWTRGNTEPCLLAVKGKPKRASASVGQLIEWPLGKHSAKPPITRDKIIQLMGGGAAIELFARSSAAGWDVWGDQAPMEETPEMPAPPPLVREAVQMNLLDIEAVGNG